MTSDEPRDLERYIRETQGDVQIRDQPKKQETKRSGKNGISSKLYFNPRTRTGYDNGNVVGKYEVTE